MHINNNQLKAMVERIELLNEQKSNIQLDIRELYSEAKAVGFDTAILRKIIRLRHRSLAERQEEAALLDLYMDALGMTPIEARIHAEAQKDNVDPETGEVL